MIRTIVVALICLAGLGAIAAAAIRSPSPAPGIARPVVAGNKADRLSLIVSEDVPTAAAKVETAYVQPTDEAQSSPPVEMPSVATPTVSDLKPSKVDVPRRAKATAAPKQRDRRGERVASAERSRKDVSAPAAKPDSTPPPNQTTELKECSSSGLDPLLRKLNLAPQCN
jgi:hypothetical protein